MWGAYVTISPCSYMCCRDSSGRQRHGSASRSIRGIRALILGCGVRGVTTLVFPTSESIFSYYLIWIIGISQHQCSVSMHLMVFETQQSALFRAFTSHCWPCRTHWRCQSDCSHKSRWVEERIRYSKFPNVLIVSSRGRMALRCELHQVRLQGKDALMGQPSWTVIGSTNSADGASSNDFFHVGYCTAAALYATRGAAKCCQFRTRLVYEYITRPSSTRRRPSTKQSPCFQFISLMSSTDRITVPPSNFVATPDLQEALYDMYVVLSFIRPVNSDKSMCLFQSPCEGGKVVYITFIYWTYLSL